MKKNEFSYADVETGILLCRQNPKIFRIDDTEIIGDGIPV